MVFCSLHDHITRTKWKYRYQSLPGMDMHTAMSTIGCANTPQPNALLIPEPQGCSYSKHHYEDQQH
jgi:hypothetical protein